MMAKEIQKIMIEQDIKKCELAAKLNTTSSNLYNKFKRDNFSECELNKIADALGYKLKIEFIPKEDK
ncbi:MAG: helix-turn-helix domain-containing protein [Lachnospira eligens]|jgi:DNA-binding Xre family transcriptional regulator